MRISKTYWFWAIVLMVATFPACKSKDINKTFQNALDDMAAPERNDVVEKNPVIPPETGNVGYLYSRDGYNLIVTTHLYPRNNFFEAEDKEYLKIKDLPVRQIADKIASLHTPTEGQTPAIYFSGLGEIYECNEEENCSGDKGGLFTYIDNAKHVRYGAELDDNTIKLFEINNGRKDSSDKGVLIENISPEPSILFTQTDYAGFKLALPDNFEPFKSLSPEQAALAIRRLKDLDKSLEWIMVLDGIGKIEDHPVYEWSILTGTGKDHSLRYRAAITENGELYLYSPVPIKRATIPESITVPSYEDGNESWLTNEEGSFKVCDFDGYAVITPIPQLKLRDKNIPFSDAAGIYQTILQEPTSSQLSKIQTVQIGNETISLVQGFQSYIQEGKNIYLKGVNSIDGKEALVYKVEFKYNGILINDAITSIIQFQVTNDHDIYQFIMTPQKESTSIEIKETPSSMNEQLEQLKKQHDEHPELFMNKPRSGFSTHYDKNYINAVGIDEFKKISANNADQYIRPLIQDYTGSQNDWPWFIYLMDIIKINGKDAYHFDVGQGFQNKRDIFILKRFSAALTNEGDLYLLENDEPKLVRNIFSL